MADFFPCEDKLKPTWHAIQYIVHRGRRLGASFNSFVMVSVGERPADDNLDNYIIKCIYTHTHIYIYICVCVIYNKHRLEKKHIDTYYVQGNKMSLCTVRIDLWLHMESSLIWPSFSLQRNKEVVVEGPSWQWSKVDGFFPLNQGSFLLLPASSLC